MACGWGAPPRPAGGCEYAKDATPSSAANIRTFLLRIALLSYPKPPNHQTVLSSQSRQATADERTESPARGSLVDVISFQTCPYSVVPFVLCSAFYRRRWLPKTWLPPSPESTPPLPATASLR